MERKRLAIIHIAKKQIGISDENYRALLASCAGVESSKDIETEAQFRAVMKAFETLGYAAPRDDQEREYTPPRLWACTPMQRKKILALWYTRARNRSMAALRAFMARTAKVNFEGFLTPEAASEVITALEKLPERFSAHEDIEQ